MRLLGRQQALREIIEKAADKHRVPRKVALAFAWCESRLNADALGDLGWSQRDGGARYRKHVLGSRALARNPARDVPEAWCSYGAFQLLACYFVGPMEHPSTLLVPEINADRACKHIALLLRRTGGDVEAARLLYVGLPLDSQSPERASVLANLRQALSKFEDA